MSIKMKPIGYVSTDAKEIPRSWTMSDVEGALVMDETYLKASEIFNQVREYM